MSRWEHIAIAAPEFAEAVRQRFDKYRHKIVATLRRDGSPRISGVEAEFSDGEIWLGMMPGSLKALDLRRDPRLALHSGTEDPPEPPAPGTVIDAKLAGRAIEVASPGADDEGTPAPHRFRVDIDEVVLVALGEPADHLLIQVWTERAGLTARRRY